ncbi:MAG: hypothetical protein ACLUB2_02380 [Butyricicoccus pullicaecorum]
MQAHKPQTVYVPLAELAGEPDTVRSLLAGGMPLAVHMPRIYTDAEQPEIERMLDIVRDCGVQTACVMNVGQLPLLRRKGFTVHGGFGLLQLNCGTRCTGRAGRRSTDAVDELRTAAARHRQTHPDRNGGLRPSAADDF